MRLHFWYVNLRNERGVLSFSRTVCVHVCSSLTLWEEFLHRVYSGATYAFRKAFCCDWMWYRNNPDGHRGGVNTFYSLCIFEGTSCIGGIVGVRLSVKCKQIPRTSDPCSGPTGLASENVERSRLGHSLEKMWFSFGRSGSCGMQDAGNISFWKISCWHFWVWDMQRGSQAHGVWFEPTDKQPFPVRGAAPRRRAASLLFILANVKDTARDLSWRSYQQSVISYDFITNCKRLESVSITPWDSISSRPTGQRTGLLQLSVNISACSRSPRSGRPHIIS